MSDLPKKEPAAANDVPTRLQMPVHFIKSSCFRVVHANGVWYGGDNQSNLHLTFFNERNPIPKKVVVNVDERGAVIGEEVSQRISKQGIVREMEVDVVLSLQVAQELYMTLGENLKAFQSVAKLPVEEKIKAIQESIKHGHVVPK